MSRIKINLFSFYSFLLLTSFFAMALVSLQFFSVTVLSFMSIIYVSTLSHRTRYGNSQYKKWLAFSSFLKDLSPLTFDPLPSMAIWEENLVYAQSWGIAKEIIQDLVCIYKWEDLNNPNLTYLRFCLASLPAFRKEENSWTLLDSIEDLATNMRILTLDSNKKRP